MLLIQDDLWRSECVAGITYNSEITIQIFLAGADTELEYVYDTKEEAEQAYKVIAKKWTDDIEGTVTP